jgi:DNA topoisomerase IB/N-acetylglutamate synthase-like GNAT family acetyltransferase
VDPRVLLKLEAALVRRLRASWKRESTPVYLKIQQAITDCDWPTAVQQVYKLDMTHVGDENREWIRHMLLSFAVFGAKMANKRGPLFLNAGTYDQRLDHITDIICQYFEHRATALVQARALQSIAEAEREAKTQVAYKFEEDEARDVHGRWTAGGPSLWHSGQFEAQISKVGKTYDNKADMALLSKRGATLEKRSSKIQQDFAYQDDNPEGFDQELEKLNDQWTAVVLAQEGLKRFHDKPTETMFIARDGDRLSGLAYGFVRGDQMELDRLASFQRGAGSKLLVEFEQNARDRGLQSVVLHSTHYAEGFYTAHGYTSKGKNNEYGIVEFEKDLTKTKTVKKIDPEEIACLAVPADWKPRAIKGDLPGHEFHGNQWTQAAGQFKYDPAAKAWTGGTDVQHQRLRDLRVPPAWANVRLNPDADAALQALGVDVKGRTQYLYSAAHSEQAAAEKFQRLKDFNAVAPKAIKQALADMQNKQLASEKRDAAAVVYLIGKTGLRVGSDAETGGAVKAHGATTLLGQHVTLLGDKLSLDFVGKKGVQIHKELTDPKLAQYLKGKVKSMGDRLFNTTDSAVRTYLKDITGDQFKVKDFRTWHGTSTALQELKDRPVPKTATEFKRVVSEVAKVVAKHLGNTPAVAKSAYIDPAVWGGWGGKFAVTKQEVDQPLIDEFLDTHQYDQTGNWRLLPDVEEEDLESAIKDDMGSADLQTAGALNPMQAQAPVQSRRSLRRRRRRKGETRTLYVHRPVINGQTIVDWAKTQGFETCLPLEKMHVTIAYSKQPVDWNAMGDADTRNLHVDDQDDREVKPLGSDGAVVLKFVSKKLHDRWKHLCGAGASWDYEGYQPHVTITWEAPKGLELSTVEPYTGPIDLGPEQFEELDEDWGDKVVEKADETGRYVTPFTSFADEGEGLVQMVSSLNSSRMATWGFTAEADQLGVGRYRLTAVLDGRTSEFCRIIDGRVFDVDDARRKVNEVLAVQDPSDLEQVQPWPDQSKAAIAEYEGMSDDDLVALGLNIPPFHPNAVFAGTTFVSYGALDEMIGADYHGPAILIKTSEGAEFTIGPNHPILTQCGMRLANCLCEGDYLVYDTRVEMFDFISSGRSNSNFKNVPFVEDAFESLLPMGKLTRVAATTDDFHGDGVFCEGEIQIVIPANRLLFKFDSLGVEHFREYGFIKPNASLANVSTDGSGYPDIEPIYLSAPGSVGSRLAGVFRLHRVVSVTRTQYKGKAFDATTASGVYNCDGFVVSNCRTMCEMVDADEGEPEELAVTGPLDKQQSTAEDFAAVGVEVTDDQLAYWNDAVGLDPQKALETMFAGDVEALTAKLDEGQDPIDVDEGGSISFVAAGDLGDGTYDLQSVFDPFTGTLYLTDADFTTTDPQVVAEFISRVFDGMIDTGMSAGATALAIDVGDSAYEYAKMGFRPDPGDWEDIRGNAMDALQSGDLQEVFDSLDDDQKNQVLNTLNNPDEHAVQDLANLPIEFQGQSVGELILQSVSGQFTLDLTDDDAVEQAKSYFE